MNAIRSRRLPLVLAVFLLACSPGGMKPAVTAPANLRIETLARGLDTPWAIDFAPDGRIFVSERGGAIRIVKDGVLLPEPWLTLDVASTGEAGLLGLALDPDFARNGFVYVAYTYRSGLLRLTNRLVRLREQRPAGTGVLDKILIDQVPGAGNHNGGRVRFGPDRRLYWTTGDAQTSSLAQTSDSLAGKILRLDPSGAVPEDNPLPHSYVYSMGHRNPQGLAWQPESQRLFATEHGPSGFQGCCRDEVNLIAPGGNYGWPILRGEETRAGLIAPVIHAGTRETWAPAGAAFVSAGPWAGSLLFAGLRGQTLYRLRLDPAVPDRPAALERYLFRRFGRLRDVAEGPDGRLYLLTSNRDGRGTPAPEDDRILRLSFD